jgi:hypothetical protein
MDQLLKSLAHLVPDTQPPSMYQLLTQLSMVGLQTTNLLIEVQVMYSKIILHYLLNSRYQQER